MKNRFGIGYHLRIEINDRLKNIHDITSLVNQYVPNSKLTRKTKTELLFNLPRASDDKFSELFIEFDDKILNDEGIISYGLKHTSLEDVFLKINYLDEKLKQKNGQTKGLEFNNIKFERNLLLILKEFIRIRALIFFRNWQYLILILFQIISLLILIIWQGKVSVKTSRRSLNSYYYSDRVVLYHSYIKHYKLDKEIKKLQQFFQTIPVDDLTLTFMHDRHYAIAFFSDNTTRKGYNIALLINGTYTHAFPILQNAVTNMLIQSSKFQFTNNPKLQINLNAYPLPNREDFGRLQFVFIYIFFFGISLIQQPILMAIDCMDERLVGHLNQIYVDFFQRI